MTVDLELRSFDAAGALPILEHLIAVYVRIYHQSADAFHGAERFRKQISSHMAAPGWRLVTASKGDELAGYAYGFPLPPTTRWWQGLRTPVPDGFAEEDGDRTFAISEIMVCASWRRQGVACRLHDELLAGRPEPRATLLAEPDNEAAQAAYAAWGWRKVAELRPHWDDAPLYDVLLKFS